MFFLTCSQSEMWVLPVYVAILDSHFGSVVQHSHYAGPIGYRKHSYTFEISKISVLKDSI